jgi:choline-sulfatase
MPRRVILISVDDLRYDAISCEPDTRYLRRYGLAALRSTPTLDSLAARGARFGQAIAAASYTPASHATMLTGRFPPSHGVRAFLAHGLDSEARTLAETFAASGFHTVSAIDFADMFSLLGLDRGFERRFGPDDGALLAHLAEHSAEPLFCFLHLVDVHPPVGESYCPPWDGYNDDFYEELQATAADLDLPGGALRAEGLNAEQARRAAVTLSGRIRTWAEDRRIADVVELPRYLAGVRKFDSGRLRYLLSGLEEAGLLEDALLVVTSDHGQAPMADWRMGDPTVPLKFDHGETLVEEVIRVPLLMAGPRIPPGTAVDRQVSLADLAPTLLDWAGLDPEDGTQGRSLLDMLEGANETDSPAYAEVWFHDRGELSRHLRAALRVGQLPASGYQTFLHQRVVRTPRFKYSRRGSELDAADWAAPDREFVRTAHEKLMSRIPDPVIAAEHARQLRDGSRTREQLAADLEARTPDRRALYNLDDDPHEEVNLLVLARSLRRMGEDHPAPEIAGRLGAVMDAIEDRAVKLSPTATASADSDLARVESRLRDLGYVD